MSNEANGTGRGTPAHMWSMGVEYEQSEDAWARGMGTGLRIAAVTMGYDPKSDGWEMDWDSGRWVRSRVRQRRAR